MKACPANRQQGDGVRMHIDLAQGSGSCRAPNDLPPRGHHFAKHLPELVRQNSLGKPIPAPCHSERSEGLPRSRERCFAALLRNITLTGLGGEGEPKVGCPPLQLAHRTVALLLIGLRIEGSIGLMLLEHVIDMSHPEI